MDSGTAPATRSDAPVWTPAPARAAATNLARFTARHRPGADYAELWRWSVERPAEFWPAVWDFCGVVAEARPGRRPWDAVLEGGERMAPPDPALGPRWFRGARLNLAENLLRFADERPALVAWDERGRRDVLSFAALRREVARWQAALHASGVGVGDRVVGVLPNTPEAVIAMLATTSVGAIWSSASPDFGEAALLNAFGQIQPKLLVAVEGYRLAGREYDVRAHVASLAARLPGLERVVRVPGPRSPAPRPDEDDARAVAPPARDGEDDTRDAGPPPRHVALGTWLASAGPRSPGAEPTFVRLPFDHPAYILFSSGTEGLPKAIVHGAGGTLLQHLKEQVLHTDVGRDDRVFYFTTCAWMMWNWLVSNLASGATIVLYEGSPLAPRPDVLWEMAAAERVTVFGTSARYLARCEKDGLHPGREHDLATLRAVLSTGSPLPPHSFDWVHAEVRRDVHLASISGGTDIVSCFALGNPTAPVWRGELQCRGLGMAVDVFDPEGRSRTSGAGELVCTRPFPSMPVAFWNDPGGKRYRSAYFDHFPGAWRHGDWAERTAHDGLVIHGRSDATLNPGGVRIGTADLYRQVDEVPEVVESLAVAQEWEEDVRIVLFVRLRDGLVLDEALRARIRDRVREGTSRHHVPRRIVQVADLPRTRNGKLSELAVRAAIHGRPVRNREVLANPEALDLFRDLPELAT